MDIFDSKGRRIRLTDKNFLAEGGEGRLYADRSNVYKLYLSPEKLIPAKKMDELVTLEHPSIIRPQGAIYDKGQTRVGFSMKRVNNPVPLPRIFTSTYWSANGVTPEKMLSLVKKMQKTVSFIHEKGFLQVDGNEFNYMTDSALATPYFIDVDSYQTPSFPATAIMPSIRDYTQSGFDEGTDWFSFAIVAFQMMVGIHPFKGRHKDFKKNDFEGRIKAGVSVLDKEVSYPASVRDFSIIPKPYMDWFEALFIKGDRVEPPSGATQVAAAPIKRVIRNGDKIKVTRIATFPSPIKRASTVNGQRIVVAGETLYVGKTEYPIPYGSKGVIMGDNGKPYFLLLKEGQLSVNDNGVLVQSGISASEIFVSGNVPYVLDDDALIEVNLLTMGGRVVVAPGEVRRVLPNAISIYSNIVYENVLGKAHLLLPVGRGVMPVIKVPELDGYKVIDGRYEKGVAMLLVATQDGAYKQMLLRFTDNYESYDVSIHDDAGEELNFTVLDKGVIVTIVEDGNLVVESAQSASSSFREVRDDQIKTFMRLSNNSGRVMFSERENLYEMTMAS